MLLKCQWSSYQHNRYLRYYGYGYLIQTEVLELLWNVPVYYFVGIVIML